MNEEQKAITEVIENDVIIEVAFFLWLYLSSK